MILKQQKIVRLKNFNKIPAKHKVYFVRSYAEETKFYEVNKTRRECACPHFQETKKLCKHLKKVLGIEDVSGFSVSLLKSALQKSIRRNLPLQSVKIAKKMIKKDAKSFLRRLGVIIVEDVMLHPDFERLIELASDSSDKDFVLSKENEKFCLELVEQLARCLFRDVEFMEYQRGRKEIDLPISFDDLKGEELKLVKALRWRSGLGGMKGDMEMLRLSARIWTRRFQNGELRASELKKYFPKPEIDYSEIPERDASDDILLEAVDFHVLKSIPKMILRKIHLKEKLMQVSGLINDSQLIDLLVSVIWRMRSGINYKLDFQTKKVFEWLEVDEERIYDKSEKEKYKRIYKIINEDLDKISLWYINKSLEN
jgi:hypothetical protein